MARKDPAKFRTNEEPPPGQPSDESRRLAAEHRPLAIRTLAKIMRSNKASASAKVSAATRMLETADGRPAQQQREVVPAGGKQMNVFIVNYSTGEREKLDVQGWQSQREKQDEPASEKTIESRFIDPTEPPPPPF